MIDSTLAFHAAVGAPPTWVLSNHDVDRHVSRYGRADTSFGLDRRDHSQPVDLELGTRRARAAALLTMALPGLGLPLPGGGAGPVGGRGHPGRAPPGPDLAPYRRCRPRPGRLPGPAALGRAWSRRSASRRPRAPWRSPANSRPPPATPPWLPQPKEWRELTVELQADDPDSMLELYRAALRLRRAEPALGDGPLHWLPAPAGVLAFGRGDLSCVANLSPRPVALPGHTAVLLASGPLDDDLLPDTAAWLRNPGVSAEPPPA